MTKRVTLDLSPQLYSQLNAMEKFVDASSKAEVIRNALRVYEYFVRRRDDGYTFQAISPDGRTETLVLFVQ